MNGGNDLAGGLLLMIAAAWLFARTWWGGLPHLLARRVS